MIIEISIIIYRTYERGLVIIDITMVSDIQDISAATLFSRLGDFAIPRILIFADVGAEHSYSSLV